MDSVLSAFFSGTITGSGEISTHTFQQGGGENPGISSHRVSLLKISRTITNFLPDQDMNSLVIFYTLGPSQAPETISIHVHVYLHYFRAPEKAFTDHTSFSP